MIHIVLHLSPPHIVSDSHAREVDYRYQTIGRKVSMTQIRKLEEETAEMEEQLIALRQEVATLQDRKSVV